jgi:hypothetical protein
MNLKLREVGADKWFAFGAMLLIIIGCEIYTGLHVLKFLRDNAAPAIGLLVFGTFSALFYTYYAMCSTNTTRSRTALALKLVLMGVMIGSAVSVIVYNQQMTQAERAKIEAVAKEEREGKATNEKAQTLVAGAAELAKIKDPVVRREIARQLGAATKTAQPAAVATEEELRMKAGLAKPDEGLMVAAKANLFAFADNMAIVYVPSLINFICFCVMVCVLAATATAATSQAQDESAPRHTMAMSPSPQSVAAKQTSTTITGGGNFHSLP